MAVGQRAIPVVWPSFKEGNGLYAEYVNLEAAYLVRLWTAQTGGAWAAPAYTNKRQVQRRPSCCTPTLSAWTS